MEEKKPDPPKSVRQQNRGWYRVGDLIEIDGFIFVVKSVKPSQITLKLKGVRTEGGNVRMRKAT